MQAIVTTGLAVTNATSPNPGETTRDWVERHLAETQGSALKYPPGSVALKTCWFHDGDEVCEETEGPNQGETGEGYKLRHNVDTAEAMAESPPD